MPHTVMSVDGSQKSDQLFENNEEHLSGNSEERESILLRIVGITRKRKEDHRRSKKSD